MRIFLADDLMRYERAAFVAELSPRGHEIVEADAEVLVTGGCAVSAEALAAHPRLARVVRFARGGADLDAERERLSSCGIGVAHLHAISAASTAEHAMAMLLAMLRRLPESTAEMLAGRWCHRDISEAGIRDLAEVTIGIVGMGAVGRRLATLARAFGAQVVYTQRHRLEAAQERALGVFRAALADLLREADAVCLAARTAPGERPLLNRDRLAMMKRDAILVSVGSGADVDLAALRDAVASGALRAALDVFPREPADLAWPADANGRVLLSPHVAGRSRATAAAIAAAVAGAIPSSRTGPRPRRNGACDCRDVAATDALVARLASARPLGGRTVQVPARLAHLGHAATALGATVEPAASTGVDALAVAPFARIHARWGSDFAALDALLPRYARGSLPGRRLLVRSYDDDQRRVAQRMRALGMDVGVVEDDPQRRLEAILDGFATLASSAASPHDLRLDPLPPLGVPAGLADEETAATLALLVATAVPSLSADELFASAFIVAREGRGE
jgi:D-3-phosphoglycerate dehydrogenase